MKNTTHMKILVVDDSIHVHHQIKAFLSSGGYNNLVFTSTATEAFTYLGLSKKPFMKTEVDLILLDIQMDDIGGIEAAKAIKEKNEYKHLPILMITGEDSEESLEKAFNAGAVDYITKPLRKIELLARISSFLMLRQETIRRKDREQELMTLTAELRKANNTLSQMAESDGLTGAPNRRFFDKMLQREWRRAARNTKPLTLLMIDIDHFKLYNDNYGHLEGDKCLKQISQAMNEVLFRPGDFLARYGGEEFAVVLPETDIDGAVHIAEELADSIASLALPHAYSPVSTYVTISIGIAAVIPAKNKEPENLINLADQALYQAKNQGRNKWCISEQC